MNLLEALISHVLPTNLGGVSYKSKFDYDGSFNVIYAGFAQRGTLASAPYWLIIRFTYDVNNNVTDAEISLPSVAWTDRVTVSYA